MRKRILVATVCMALALTSACGANTSVVANSSSQLNATADAPPSIKAMIAKPYHWGMVGNSTIDPQPEVLNAGTNEACDEAKLTQPGTCDSKGPFRGQEVTIICLNSNGSVMGVIVPEEQLVRPDQLRFRSKQGDLPIGFMTLQAIGGYNWALFNELAQKLNTTIDNDGLNCDSHINRIR
jgi:hypothetical protein